jgi:hypothetical protein
MSHGETISADVQACQVHEYHWPKPRRSVKHHIFPQEFGGQTTPTNLVWTCDTGHYNIHDVLNYMLANEGKQPKGATKEERHYAQLGYDAWVAAGKPKLGTENESEEESHGES